MCLVVGGKGMKWRLQFVREVQETRPGSLMTTALPSFVGSKGAVPQPSTTPATMPAAPSVRPPPKAKLRRQERVFSITSKKNVFENH